MENLKSFIKTHILTICAVISLVVMAFPFVIINTEMEVMGQSAGSQVIVSGFKAIEKSFFTFLLIVGPVVIAIMNYVKPLEKYKGLLAVAVPVACIIIFIIVFLQVKGSQVSASGGGFMSTEIKAGIGIGGILALASYVATAIAGAVTYHNFTLDKEGLKKLKEEGLAMAKNLQDKASDIVSSATDSIGSAISANSSASPENGTVPSSNPSAAPSIKPRRTSISHTEEILQLIEKLYGMKEAGILTEEEFSSKKKSLLEEI